MHGCEHVSVGVQPAEASAAQLKYKPVFPVATDNVRSNPVRLRVLCAEVEPWHI